MKSRRFVATLLLVLTLFAVPAAVRAQDVTAARQQLISERCVSLKLLLDELQRRDLVSRTNLGREYESFARLFSAFTQRVKNNNLSPQPFEQLASQFTNATAEFRTAYVQYDDSMVELQEIDCKTKPAEFDGQLTRTRALRDATEGASTHAAATAGQYRTQMVQLQTQLPPQKGSN